MCFTLTLVTTDPHCSSAGPSHYYSHNRRVYIITLSILLFTGSSNSLRDLHNREQHRKYYHNTAEVSAHIQASHILEFLDNSIVLLNDRHIYTSHIHCQCGLVHRHVQLARACRFTLLQGPGITSYLSQTRNRHAWAQYGLVSAS